MTNRKTLFLAMILLLFCIPPLYAQETLLLRTPSISEQNIAFVFGGDIWIADRDGSHPRRLTVNPAVEQNPVFSPDGQQIAFTGNYDGNTDVYSISIHGGEPKRLTHHPASDVMRGWIDNEHVYFTSIRDFHYALSPRLHSISLDGTTSEALPMPEAIQGSPSPDGRYWAYIKNTDPTERDRVAFKRYRGGGMPTIWIFDTQTSEIEIVPGANSNNVKPLWLGNKVYFLSDRDKIVNIFSYDATSKQIQKLSNFTDYDVKSLAGNGQTLVFEQAGKIHTMGATGDNLTALAIHVQADALYKRPHYVNLDKNIRNFGISPTGQRAIFESRGEIYTVPKEKGDARNISSSPGTHEKFPSWSPDGKWISYLSDRNGNYELVLRDQAAKDNPITIPLGETAFYFEPVWSPDSKKLFYNDSHLNLYYVDIHTQQVVLVDDDKLGSHTGRVYNHFQPSWSPDSKWIAYIKTLPNTVSAIYMYNLNTKEKLQVTDGMSAVNGPTFSRDGNYLFFNASTNTGLTNSGLHMSAYQRPTTYSVYAFILSEDTPSLFKPESDEETIKIDSAQRASSTKKSGKKEAKAKTDTVTSNVKDIKVDSHNIANRIVALPLPEGYYQLDGSVQGMLLYRKGQNLGSFDLKKREDKTLIEGISGFQVSADGKKMIYKAKDDYFIVDAGKKPSPTEPGKIKIDGIKQYVDPEAEWNQVFNEVWAMQKEFFYVENMHGADWPAMKTKYEKFLPFVNHRSDLGYLLNEMMGEMVVGHNYIYPGDEPSAPAVQVGLLGADYEIENNLYRIKKIFTRLDWNPKFKAPLAEPGLTVKEGDYIVAVNGIPLSADTDIYSLFDYTVGKQIHLKINGKPSLEGAREVTVLPISYMEESQLRRMDWVENNRKRTYDMSNGKIAYIYMPNTGPDGYTYFNRYYFSQMDKKALLIDERNNGGGWVADYVIDLLTREPISYWAIRDGKSFSTPGNGIYGPKAMIINENAGSGGDMLPYMFRLKGLGKVVGRTTMGILVGISGYPPLLDGGSITSPNFGIFDTDGKWIIENEGVAPDVFIEQTPKDLLEGRDPQLEKTVEILLEEMKTFPYKEVKNPSDPVRVN